jgi:hypothetical protein
MVRYGEINDNNLNNIFINTINLVLFISRCPIRFLSIFFTRDSQPLELISGKSRLY